MKHTDCPWDECVINAVREISGGIGRVYLDSDDPLRVLKKNLDEDEYQLVLAYRQCEKNIGKRDIFELGLYGAFDYNHTKKFVPQVWMITKFNFHEDDTENWHKVKEVAKELKAYAWVHEAEDDEEYEDEESIELCWDITNLTKEETRSLVKKVRQGMKQFPDESLMPA